MSAPFPLTLAALFGGDVTLTLEHITDHVERGLIRLIEQYRGKENMEAFISVYPERLQLIEDALWDIYEKRSLDTATGVQLDVLGRLLGLPRGGYADEDYRSHLRAQIKLLKSSGTAEQIYEILAVAAPNATLEIAEAFPAAFVVKIGTLALGAGTAALLASFVRKARGGGIYAVTEWKPQEESATFKWDTANQGWDDGKWAGAIES